MCTSLSWFLRFAIIAWQSRHGNYELDDPLMVKIYPHQTYYYDDLFAFLPPQKYLLQKLKMSLLKVTNVLECPIKSDHYISGKKQSYCCCGIFFADYAILKFFSIFMKITNKVPKCPWKGPKKSRFYLKVLFFPLQQISAWSPDGKILYCIHWCSNFFVFIVG